MTEPKKKRQGCKNCERLREELSLALDDLKDWRRRYYEISEACSEQTTLISKLIDSKEQVSTVADSSTRKPAGWLSRSEVVVHQREKAEV